MPRTDKNQKGNQEQATHPVLADVDHHLLFPLENNKLSFLSIVALGRLSLTSLSVLSN